MKALVFHGDHDVRYEEVPVPEIGDQDVFDLPCLQGRVFPALTGKNAD